MPQTNHDRASALAEATDRELLERLRSATELLESIAFNRAVLGRVPVLDRERLHRAIAEVYNPDPIGRRRMVRAAERERTAARTQRVDAALDETGIRTLRRRPVFTSPNVFPPPDFDERARESAKAEDPQHCYICKQKFSTIHHFYDQMCPPCAEFNLKKRTELADLRGRVALLTGGRVKIGYQAGLKILRAGARLIVTSRFPRDAARRYGQEPDFDQWAHRLEIFGMDMRHTPSVEAFCRRLLETLPRL
ncbi:MAG: oxidoreductase, partial [Acidobacteriota bacterium]|nr:oxidoreductase [Acidobacteriota bacterium]